MQNGERLSDGLNTMKAAAHLHLLAPQGTACSSEVADWIAEYIGGEAAKFWGEGCAR